MKKLHNQNGESLVEVLVSILILALTFVFLTTAVITAAKINRKVQDTDTSFLYSTGAGSAGTIQFPGGNSATVTVFTTVNGYQYYEAGGAGS